MHTVAPVSVCLIVKNEPLIEQCLKSIRPHVAEICIVDTGSTDGTTQDICRKYADKFEIYLDCNGPDGLIESFSQARQRSFSLASNEWVMWIDGDDEVRGADKLAALIAQKDIERNGNPYLIMFPYEYSRDNEGNINCIHWRERLVAPGNLFKWVSPVHEVLTPESPNTYMNKNDSISIVHHRDNSGKVVEPLRNLRILKTHYNKMGDSDVRLLYYLGLEYGNAGDLGNAIKFHKRYIELSGWDDEKFLACLKVAEHYQAMGQYEDSVQWALKSLTIREGWGEAYFNLGRSYYFMAQRGGPETRRNWERSVYFFRMGLSSPPTDTILFINPLERNFEVHKFLNLALNSIGDVNGALDSVNSALSVKPNDEGLNLNKKIYEIHFARVRITEALQLLTKYGEIDGAAESLVQNVVTGRLKMVDPPQNSEQPPQQIIESNLQISDSQISVIDDKKLDIALFVGYGCGPWNPDTISKGGNGGSEIAAMHMAKRLSGYGHRIRLFGDCEHLEGVFDGVEYIHYGKFKNIECDLLITSRRPNVVDDEFNVKARATICWVHDVHCGSALNHARALKIDKFLCLSQWHKDFFLNQYNFIHPDQVLVTRNGIDLSRFNEATHGIIKRNPHRAVYSSSPDRGLETVVRLWPRLRERVPDAELHIFYGFETWEISAKSYNDQGQLNLISVLRQLVNNSKQYGVHYHGRVDQISLAKEFLQSGVWPYTTWFTETSCITAMEAHAAGLRIITSPIAALNETVGPRGVMIAGDWLSKEYSDAFVDAISDAMLKPDVIGERENLQNYAKDNFGWDSLAKEWSENLLPGILSEVESNIVTPYKSLL